MTIWNKIKDAFLPFENPDHPLYYNHQEVEDEEDDLTEAIFTAMEQGETLHFYKHEDGTVSLLK